MAAVCASEHFGECIAARPLNRERLMKVDVQHFVQVMTYWRGQSLEAASLPVVGATEADLRSIDAPVCVIAGNDVIHTPSTARKIAGLVRNGELHDDVVSRRADNDLLKEWDRNEWQQQEKRMAQIFAAFLQRGQAERSVARRAARRDALGKNIDNSKTICLEEIVWRLRQSRRSLFFCG